MPSLPARPVNKKRPSSLSKESRRQLATKSGAAPKAALNTRRAQSGIKHALNLKAESLEANFIAAKVYWHEGARSQAIDFLNKAIQLQPAYPEAHLLLAKYLTEQDKLDEARGELTIAINQGVPLFSAYCLLSEIEIAKGDFDSATSSLESAILFSTNAQNEEVSSSRQKIAQARELHEKLKQFSELEAASLNPH